VNVRANGHRVPANSNSTNRVSSWKYPAEELPEARYETV